MSADLGIEALLEKAGFGESEAKARARAALEEAKLTHPGKQRISNEKIPRVEAVLKERFFLHCGDPQCLAVAQGSGRELVRASDRSCCQGCGGSDNWRASAALIEACRSRSVRRLVVVGGSPSVREELENALGGSLELRMIDGTERRTADRARNDLEWADLVLIWGASELHHKVSLLYTQASPGLRRKVVMVARRGIAALLSAAIEHLRKS